MKIRNLIEQLEGIARQHGDDVDIRLAIKPNWPSPIEHSIERVVCIDPETVKENFINELIKEGGMTFAEATEAYGNVLLQTEEPIVYIAEDRAIRYLDSVTRGAIGW